METSVGLAGAAGRWRSAAVWPQGGSPTQHRGTCRSSVGPVWGPGASPFSLRELEGLPVLKILALCYAN